MAAAEVVEAEVVALQTVQPMLMCEQAGSDARCAWGGRVPRQQRQRRRASHWQTLKLKSKTWTKKTIPKIRARRADEMAAVQ